jgi:hypothetical protein
LRQRANQNLGGLWLDPRDVAKIEHHPPE